MPESVERKEPENSDTDDFNRTTSMFVMGVNGSKSNNTAKAETPAMTIYQTNLSFLFSSSANLLLDDSSLQDIA